jgi:hypothetical protein
MFRANNGYHQMKDTSNEMPHVYCMCFLVRVKTLKQTNSVALSPRANYTDYST